MKPSRAQYFIAQGWPIRIVFGPWVTVFPVLFAYVVLRLCVLTYDPWFQWWNLLRITYYVVIALLLGFLLGAAFGCFFGSLVLIPLHYIRGRMNGAPFREGDLVRILAGPHRGRIGRVCASSKGNSVQVELGEKENEKFSGVFSPIELMRETNAEPSGGLNAGSADVPPSSVN